MLFPWVLITAPPSPRVTTQVLGSPGNLLAETRGKSPLSLQNVVSADELLCVTSTRRVCLAGHCCSPWPWLVPAVSLGGPEASRAWALVPASLCLVLEDLIAPRRVGTSVGTVRSHGGRQTWLPRGPLGQGASLLGLCLPARGTGRLHFHFNLPFLLFLFYNFPGDSENMSRPTWCPTGWHPTSAEGTCVAVPGPHSAGFASQGTGSVHATPATMCTLRDHGCLSPASTGR